MQTPVEFQAASALFFFRNRGGPAFSSGDGKDGRRDGRGLRGYCEKEGHRTLECRKRQKGVGKGKSKGAKKRRWQRCQKKARKGSKANASSVASRGTCRKTAGPKRDECVGDEQGGALVEGGVLRHGEHRVECAGDRVCTSVRKSKDSSHWNRHMCSSDSVPENSSRRLPRAHETRQSKELQASVGQAFARSWVQERRRSNSKMGSLRYVNPRVADTHKDLMAVSEMNDIGHDVFFPRSDRGIKAYAYPRGWGRKERMMYSSCLSSLFHTSRTLRSPAMQVHTLHSLSALEQIGSLMTQSDRDMQCSKPGNHCQVDHVDLARLAVHCGSRNGSLSWNLSRVKQDETVRVDDMHPQG